MLAVKSLAREEIILEFLAASEWAEAIREPLASDASFRRYERLRLGDKTAMLMDAAPPREDVRPFLCVTELLHAQSLRAPIIYRQDVSAGLLILEDFGTASYTSHLKANPLNEQKLYLSAVEVLISLYKERASFFDLWQPRLPVYSDEVMLREVALFCDWFLPQAVGEAKARHLKPEFLALWQSLLTKRPLAQEIIVLRDYHADNLMVLAPESSTQSVGLLDYQDALLGDAAYDLVSLLEDARRDVDPATVSAILAHYLAQTGQDRDDFMRRYAMLGAQRNMKIIGIFCRLCLRDTKPHYLHYLPRVWEHLWRDLTHPSLAPLLQWVEQHVPESSQGVLRIDNHIGSIE